MARPSVAAWNTDETNNVDPGAGRKATGFLTGGDIPDSTEMNWWMNLTYKGVKWAGDVLTGIVADAVTFAGGITVTKTGTGHGITATGGSSDGIGVFGTGGASNGRGGYFVGTGTAPGVEGLGGGTNGSGVYGQGTGTGAGLFGVGGASSGPGISATGGTSSGIGGAFIGGATNGVGVDATGTGTGAGLFAHSTTGYGAVINGNATTANIHLGHIAGAPSVAQEGDVWYDVTNHNFCVRKNGVTVTL